MSRHRWTVKTKQQFLEVLGTTGNVSAAAAAVGMSRSGAYQLREKDWPFSKAWEEAVEVGVDQLESEARRRALEGVDKPLYYQGKQCGVTKEYSDVLLIFLLKKLRPAIFDPTLITREEALKYINKIGDVLTYFVSSEDRGKASDFLDDKIPAPPFPKE